MDTCYTYKKGCSALERLAAVRQTLDPPDLPTPAPSLRTPPDRPDGPVADPPHNSGDTILNSIGLSAPDRALFSSFLAGSSSTRGS